MAFAKLDSGIVNSTIWVQPHDVLRVWVWFLSQCDARGTVRAAAPAMALACMIPVERMREIIRLLESPDEDSRTPDHDGRRIEKIEGGWRILNYGKYREARDAEERRQYQRNWDKENRSGQSRRPKGGREEAETRPESDQTRPESDQTRPESDQTRPKTTKAEAEADIEAKDESPNGDSSSAKPPPGESRGLDGEDDPPGCPPCPIERIVDEYHQALPVLARVRVLPEQARRMLRARWRESTERQDLDWWRGFFEFIRDDCPFLVGQKTEFQADLIWLVRPTNFAKVLNGNFQARSA